ncbi:MAG: hypothetical protein QOG18_862 [Microbacteriaceae bacterium]|nr:hypothetical protein [Microbacteriaceae bacterium]MDQ1526249.1 hypothetical protein [Microbacteriaceae bacterium]
MNFSLWWRRWGILALGVVFLAFGLAIFLSHSTLTFGWTAHTPVSGLAFYPGSPASYSWAGEEAARAPNRYLSFNGQLSIVIGMTLSAGWVGFRLGRRRPGEQEIRSFSEHADEELIVQD